MSWYRIRVSPEGNLALASTAVVSTEIAANKRRQVAPTESEASAEAKEDGSSGENYRSDVDKLLEQSGSQNSARVVKAWIEQSASQQRPDLCAMCQHSQSYHVRGTQASKCGYTTCACLGFVENSPAQSQCVASPPSDTVCGLCGKLHSVEINVSFARSTD